MNIPSHAIIMKTSKPSKPSLASKLIRISQAEFAAMVEAHKGAAIIGLDTFTDARPLKTGNPHARIEKLSRFVGMAGVDYAQAVNRELASESNGAMPTFEAKPLRWGQWAILPDGTRSRKIITHEGGLYIAMTSTRKTRSNRKVKVQFYADGLPVDREAVAAWLPKPKPSARQAEAGIASQAAQVERRTFSLASVKRARFNGKNYIIA